MEFRGITGTREESESRALRLWEAIKDIAVGTSNSYSDVIQNPTEENLTAIKVVESGYYWDNVREELTQEEIDSIEDINWPNSV